MYSEGMCREISFIYSRKSLGCIDPLEHNGVHYSNQTFVPQVQYLVCTVSRLKKLFRTCYYGFGLISGSRDEYEDGWLSAGPMKRQSASRRNIPADIHITVGMFIIMTVLVR